LHKDEETQLILSGNEVIDNWLTKVSKVELFIDFIPYKKFSDITYLAKGGFSKIYKATCINGIKYRWNDYKQMFLYHKDYPVVLRSLNDSEVISRDFLNELKLNFHCLNALTYHIHKYHGITQHLETKNYMIVMDFTQY
ncbi:1772_t:CDS:2, partial [Scutellospora calospora]